VPPSEPDWIARLIGGAGLVVAIIGLWFTWRRDRAAGKVNVRIGFAINERGVYSNDPSFRVTLSNVERRPVTVADAGFTVRRRFATRTPFRGFNTHRRETGGFEPPFHGGGLVLEPGGATKELVVVAFRLRGTTYPDVPSWFWCEDTRRHVYWQRVPADIQELVRSVLPRKVVPGISDLGTEQHSQEINPEEDLTGVQFDVTTPWY
jgi:hypothetical protein